MQEISNMIATLGFPICACIGLAWFCKALIDQSNKNIERMFEMYNKSNEDNRQAIEANTSVIERLCDRLDKKEF